MLTVLAQTLGDKLWDFVWVAAGVSGWTAFIVAWFLNRGLRNQVLDGVQAIKDQVAGK